VVALGGGHAGADAFGDRLAQFVEFVEQWNVNQVLLGAATLQHPPGDAGQVPGQNRIDD